MKKQGEQLQNEETQKKSQKEIKQGGGGDLDSEEPSEIFSNNDGRLDQLHNEKKSSKKQIKDDQKLAEEEIEIEKNQNGNPTNLNEEEFIPGESALPPPINTEQSSMSQLVKPINVSLQSPQSDDLNNEDQQIQSQIQEQKSNQFEQNDISQNHQEYYQPKNQIKQQANNQNQKFKNQYKNEMSQRVLEENEEEDEDEMVNGQIMDYESSIFANGNQMSILNSQMDSNNLMFNHDRSHHTLEQFMFDDTIARRVEQEKLDKIWQQSQSLKQELAMFEGRCEICTLKPPCSHFQIKDSELLDQQPKSTNSIKSNLSNIQKSKQQQKESAQQNTESIEINEQSIQANEKSNSSKKQKDMDQNNNHHHQNQQLYLSALKNKNSFANRELIDGVQSEDFTYNNKFMQQQNYLNSSRFQKENRLHLQGQNFDIFPANKISKTSKNIDHFEIMNQLAGGPLPESYSPISKNLKVSPYSILRKSNLNDLQQTMQLMNYQAKVGKYGGQRSTRSEILRQLALKQKIQNNPKLNEKLRITREMADKLGLDPFTNLSEFNQTSNQKFFQPMQGRIRDKHGIYQSIDLSQNNRDQSIIYNQQKSQNSDDIDNFQILTNRESVISGSDQMKSNILDPNNSNQFINQNSSRINHNAPFSAGIFHKPSSMSRAENRLLVIEKISKYREEKLKREFIKIEQELRIEDQKFQKEKQKELQMQQYYQEQKEKLQEYQKIKNQKLQENYQKRDQYLNVLRQQQFQKKLYYLQQKENLQEYRLMKQKQLLGVQQYINQAREMMGNQSSQNYQSNIRNSIEQRVDGKNLSQKKYKMKGRQALFNSIDFSQINFDDMNIPLQNLPLSEFDNQFAQRKGDQTNKQRNYNNFLSSSAQENSNIQILKNDAVHQRSVETQPSLPQNTDEDKTNNDGSVETEIRNISKQDIGSREEIIDNEHDMLLNLKMQNSQQKPSQVIVKTVQKQQDRYDQQFYGQKPIKIQGKLLHKSIEIPLKLYCQNGVKVVDIMSNQHKKDQKLQKLLKRQLLMRQKEIIEQQQKNQNSVDIMQIQQFPSKQINHMNQYQHAQDKNQFVQQVFLKKKQRQLEVSPLFKSKTKVYQAHGKKLSDLREESKSKKDSEQEENVNFS